MKILGEKSLSSKVIVGLKVLFTIISIVDLLVIETIVKVIIELIGMENVEKSVASLILFIMIITTGIIALFIIYQFIKIFQHLKDSELFCENNVKRLSTISIYCFVISTIYFITAIFAIATITKYFQEFVYYILFSLIILAIIFGVAGIGIKILNEIYYIMEERKMPIIVNVDVMLAKRKMSSGELAEKVGITPANLSILKTNKAKAIRFSTLEKICEVLDCKPGDVLDYEKGAEK